MQVKVQEGRLATRTQIQQALEQMEVVRYATNIRSLADACVNGETKAEQYPVKAKVE